MTKTLSNPAAGPFEQSLFLFFQGGLRVRLGPAQRHEVHHRLGAEKAQEVLQRNSHFSVNERKANIFFKNSNLAGATSLSNGRDWSTRAKTHFHERIETKTNFFMGFFNLYRLLAHLHPLPLRRGVPPPPRAPGQG